MRYAVGVRACTKLADGLGGEQNEVVGELAWQLFRAGLAHTTRLAEKELLGQLEHH